MGLVRCNCTEEPDGEAFYTENLRHENPLSEVYQEAIGLETMSLCEELHSTSVCESTKTPVSVSLSVQQSFPVRKPLPISRFLQCLPFIL